MGMIRWEWERNGNKKVIHAHFYFQVEFTFPPVKITASHNNS